MTEVVIDTNVLLVAEGKHGDISEECITRCADRLEAIQKSAIVVIDDAFRVINEYMQKLDVKKDKKAGAVFLKWLVNNQADTRRVMQVRLTETGTDQYDEFPVASLGGC